MLFLITLASDFMLSRVITDKTYKTLLYIINIYEFTVYGITVLIFRFIGSELAGILM